MPQIHLELQHLLSRQLHQQINNEIGLSLAALKDIIQLGISTNFLIAGLVVAYLIQDVNNKIESSKSRISDYGKEVVRVEQDA